MFDAPVAEVSGLCFAHDTVVVVGDREPVVGWARWTPQGPDRWRTLDVTDLPGAPERAGQFEAVEHARDGVVMVLCEDPPLLLAVDLEAARMVGSWDLHVDLDGLRKRWGNDENSRGEGLILGRDRLYVIKEKRPPAIIEFALSGVQPLGEVRPGDWRPPDGARLTALHYWELDAKDVSDATVVDDDVWLLSDQDSCIISPGGDRLELDLDKPEGLARTPQGAWLVACDDGGGKGALHLVP